MLLSLPFVNLADEVRLPPVWKQHRWLKPLIGLLHSYGWWHASLALTLNAACRTPAPGGLKIINGTYGHPTGDAIPGRRAALTSAVRAR